MPTKNTVKIYVPNSYYHAYNRGWNRGDIFLDDEDYEYFEWICARLLSREEVVLPSGRKYRNFRDKLSLRAYCLMPNHFHLLLYQYDVDAMQHFVKSLCTSYTMYFNKKHKRRGPLFENRYKAVLVSYDEQLQHITRYIHLNHWDFKTWPHSSYRDYSNGPRTWIHPQPILELFQGREAYMAFTNDYEAEQRIRESIKKELASDL